MRIHHKQCRYFLRLIVLAPPPSPFEAFDRDKWRIFTQWTEKKYSQTVIIPYRIECFKWIVILFIFLWIWINDKSNYLPMPGKSDNSILNCFDDSNVLLGFLLLLLLHSENFRFTAKPVKYTVNLVWWQTKMFLFPRTTTLDTKFN